MFNIDGGSSWYVDSFTCHLNLKPLTLLDAVSQPPQFLGELFYGIVLLDVTLAFFLLSCHLWTPFIYLVTLRDMSFDYARDEFRAEHSRNTTACHYFGGVTNAGDSR